MADQRFIVVLLCMSEVSSSLLHSRVKAISGSSAFSDVAKGTAAGQSVAVIKFGSTKCKACSKLDPLYEKVARKFGDDVDFFSMTFEYEEVATFKNAGVRLLPHLSILQGDEVVTLVGRNTSRLVETLEGEFGCQRRRSKIAQLWRTLTKLASRPKHAETRMDAET